MKLTIKVKKVNPDVKIPKVIKKGEWIDLCAASSVNFTVPQSQTLKKKTVNGIEASYRDVLFDYKLIPLGVAMKLPEGFEAVVLPRSSTFKNYGIIMTNSQGVIDSSYCGNEDEWKFPAVSLQEGFFPITKGVRICQFRIQLSQKATIWQKLKWLFSSGIRVKEVINLDENNRGGLGSTGI